MSYHHHRRRHGLAKQFSGERQHHMYERQNRRNGCQKHFNWLRKPTRSRRRRRRVRKHIIKRRHLEDVISSQQQKNEENESKTRRNAISLCCCFCFALNYRQQIKVVEIWRGSPMMVSFQTSECRDVGEPPGSLITCGEWKRQWRFLWRDDFCETIKVSSRIIEASTLTWLLRNRRRGTIKFWQIIYCFLRCSDRFTMLERMINCNYKLKASLAEQSISFSLKSWITFALMSSHSLCKR